MTGDHPSAGDPGRRRLARAVRDLGHAGVRRVVDDALLDELAARVEDVTAALDDHPDRHRDVESWFRGFFPAVTDGDELVHFVDCLVCGPENPLGLGLRTRVDGDEVVGEVVLRSAHEGAPGRAHGGIVAALFDDALGYLLTVHGIVAYTGELRVRYVAGVPIGVPVVFRSRLVGREGRRAMMEGEALVDDAVVATARGTFVEPAPEIIADVRARVDGSIA